MLYKQPEACHGRLVKVVPGPEACLMEEKQAGGEWPFSRL